MEDEREFITDVLQHDENAMYIDIDGSICNFTEILIGEVQKRPGLYNIKSSILSKSPVTVNQLWQEILEVFEGKYNK